MALIGHSHVAATTNKFFLTSREALCILLFNVQVLKQGLPSRRDPRDTVVRESYCVLRGNLSTDVCCLSYLRSDPL
jgi:hypothetical protein